MECKHKKTLVLRGVGIKFQCDLVKRALHQNDLCEICKYKNNKGGFENEKNNN